ncbi:hypothetical protein [Actinacidiphila glaucinigra]
MPGEIFGTVTRAGAAHVLPGGTKGITAASARLIPLRAAFPQ